MSLGVLNNISAIYAQNNLNQTQSALNTTLQQLSSGSRINSGADDAAGLSLANGLQASSTALSQSAKNATEGVDFLQTGDGASLAGHKPAQSRCYAGYRGIERDAELQPAGSGTHAEYSEASWARSTPSTDSTEYNGISTFFSLLLQRNLRYRRDNHQWRPDNHLQRWHTKYIRCRGSDYRSQRCRNRDQLVCHHQRAKRLYLGIQNKERLVMR
jgi:hypothetical protein